MFSIYSNLSILNKSHVWKYYCRAALSLKNNFDYSKSENDQILKFINSNNESELSKYKLSKDRARKIESWRAEHGSFSNIEQMLKLDGFGITVLKTFCNSIINNDIKEEKGKKTRASNFATPSFPDFMAHSIESCVSLNISVSGISWSHLEISRAPNNIILKHWDVFNIEDKKYHLSDLMRLALEINTSIPSADLYIIENPQTHQQNSMPGSVAKMNINLQQSQIISMIAALLANRKNHFDFGKKCTSVFFLRRYLASRYYGVFLGNENISITAVIEKLLGLDVKCNNSEINLIPSLKAIEKFKQIEKIEKEILGQSLLIGTAFVQICILKCSKSLSKLNSNIKSSM